MKKISFILIGLLILFSFLYFKRNNNLLIYSKLEERYINTSSDTFNISLYSNSKDSIYNEANYLTFSFIIADANVDLSLVRIDNEMFDGMYVYKYVFTNDLKIKGRYDDLKFEIKNYKETLIFNLGNYYFKAVLSFVYLNENIVLNKLMNISQLNLTIDKSYINSNLKININNKTQEFDISIDLLNKNYFININTEFIYDANCILIEFFSDNSSNYFMLKKNMETDNYLVLGDIND